MGAGQSCDHVVVMQVREGLSVRAERQALLDSCCGAGERMLMCVADVLQLSHSTAPGAALGCAARALARCAPHDHCR